MSLYGKSNRYKGIGKSCGCYAKWCRETEKGREKVKIATLKATKPRRELEKAENQKKQRKTLAKEIQKTQVLVNRYVRLRDFGKNCISQDIAWRKDFDAGHLYSKNTHSAIRFHLHNINAQSVFANRFLEGDFDNYLANLPNRIGESAANELKMLADECKRTTKKWTFSELQEIQEEMKLKIKEL